MLWTSCIEVGLERHDLLLLELSRLGGVVLEKFSKFGVVFTPGITVQFNSALALGPVIGDTP